MPVFIHPGFWFFLLFFVYVCSPPNVILGFLIAFGVFFSIFAHEYGHALTARCFGASPTVTLEAFGGRAEYSGSKMTAKQRFLITLNGPLFTGLLALLSHLLLKSGLFDHYFYVFLYFMRYINTVWLVFNLLPVLPLDGGRLLYHALEQKFGYAGCRATLTIGCIVAAAGAYYYFFHQSMFIFGSFLLFYGWQNFQMLRANKRFSRPTPADNPFSQYLKGVEAIKNRELDRAKAILKKLVRSKDPQIKHAAIESLAQVYFDEDDSQKSYNLLMQADQSRLKKGKCLLCKLAFEHKNYALIAEHARDIYAINPSHEIALLNSQAFGYLNRPELAGAWLKTAAQFEDYCQSNFKQTILGEAYASVRSHVDFKKYAGEGVANKR